jgi:hypothetical protein
MSEHEPDAVTAAISASAGESTDGPGADYTAHHGPARGGPARVRRDDRRQPAPR